MFRHLLVAYDASPASERALDEAIQLAASLNATLAIVTVAPGVPPFAYGAGVDVVALEDAAAAEAARRLREARDRVPQDVSVTTVQKQGHAAKAILEASAEAGADLIVMGSRGRGRAATNVLGSVAADVHFGTDLPMLIVHRSHRDDAAEARAGG